MRHFSSGVKISLLSFVVVLLLSAVAFAGNRSLTITADGAVLTSPRVLCGIYGYTGGTNDLTIVMYENSAASGRRPWIPIKIIGADNYGGASLPAIQVKELYIDITSAGGGVVTLVHGQTTCE